MGVPYSSRLSESSSREKASSRAATPRGGAALGAHPLTTRSAVANMSAALDASGMARNTLLLFTTDNGAPYKHVGGSTMSNFPLRGGKAELWEGGVRGACFLAGGALPPAAAGRRSDTLVHATDWFDGSQPCSHWQRVNLPVAHARRLYGVSAVSLLQDPASMHKYGLRTELLHNADPLTRRAALRVFDLKLVRNEPRSLR